MLRFVCQKCFKAAQAVIDANPPKDGEELACNETPTLHSEAVKGFDLNGHPLCCGNEALSIERLHALEETSSQVHPKLRVAYAETVQPVGKAFRVIWTRAPVETERFDGKTNASVIQLFAPKTAIAVARRLVEAEFVKYWSPGK